MLEQRYIDMIEDWYSQGETVAGITSLLYIKGLSGLRYFELRKYVKKEVQRLETKKLKNSK